MSMKRTLLNFWRWFNDPHKWRARKWQACALREYRAARDTQRARGDTMMANFNHALSRDLRDMFSVARW